MRLSKIKLAGFKTFVDPTSVTLPSNLSGVVGPNGCGKSNIIDAVRWVLGESSAKNLRGDELTDVIFNGSRARKPVGTAMIELVFDNSDGTIGGEYAGYSEVSIKRILSRDGVSQYFLNNTRCRRKDITRVFLGTGLGARSYAIIEQGMISRIIESKPEDLRVHVEEAAGISQYKDRRRETSNRIKHTRENLERLNDLRDEVDKQLKHLQRQANVAEKYKLYKEEQGRLNAEVIVLRLAEMQAKVDEQEALIQREEQQLEAATTRMREAEERIDARRADLADKSEAFNSVQQNYYAVAAEIARLEQSLKHARDLKARQQTDLDECQAQLKEIDTELASDQQRRATLQEGLAELEPRWQELKSAAEGSSSAAAEAEQAMSQWQQSWNEVQQSHGEQQRSASVEQARIEGLEEQLRNLLTRQEKVRVARSELSIEELEQELSALAANELELKSRFSDRKQRLAATAESIARQRDEDRTLTLRLDELRADLQQSKGRLSSVEALQQGALGQRAGSVSEWLASSELAERPRLASQLDVEAGWEHAVESVLGDYLEAVCVDGLDATAAQISRLESGRVTLVETAPAGNSSPSLLASKVRGRCALPSVLDGVRIADSLEEALQTRRSLGRGESVVTRAGVWLGREWLRINREDSEDSVLAREQEIRALRGECARLAGDVEQLSRQHDEARAALKDLEARRDAEQEAVNAAHREHVDLLASLDARRNRIEDLNNRVTTLSADADEIETAIASGDRELQEAQARFDTARSGIGSLADQLRTLEEQQVKVRGRLDAARERFEADRRAAHEVEVRRESQKSSFSSLEENLERLARQRLKQIERRDALSEQIAAGDAPYAESQQLLNQQMQERLTIEASMAAARGALEGLESAVRADTAARLEAEEAVNVQRDKLQATRLGSQELSVRRDTLVERFAETDFELDNVREGLPAEAELQQWQERLEKLERRIERLGPINLAAIDEYKESAERKEYLDTQHDDLVEALDTLEAAIRRIDKETKTRFKETFDQINEGFKQLFPKLFGGGQAYLELSDSDLLNAGVTVMARPPGKRNSTIHLLSGGEKALTAVALVFAIFELNPAPFCMLDEVDAPLDDANVNRFGNIIREMSDRVQFIVITHNKATIAMAEQLIGVTMQEPGVSRLVAVDVARAMEMAEAS